MVNLTKKTPYRRTDLICTYGGEGVWVGGEYSESYYDENGCFVTFHAWNWKCFSGSTHDCTPCEQDVGSKTVVDCN